MKKHAQSQRCGCACLAPGSTTDGKGTQLACVRWEARHRQRCSRLDGGNPFSPLVFLASGPWGAVWLHHVCTAHSADTSHRALTDDALKPSNCEPHSKPFLSKLIPGCSSNTKLITLFLNALIKLVSVPTLSSTSSGVHRV